MKKITAKEAYKLMDKLGLDYGADGTTYYATDDDETEVYEFDSLKEREQWMNRMKGE